MQENWLQLIATSFQAVFSFYKIKATWQLATKLAPKLGISNRWFSCILLGWV